MVASVVSPQIFSSPVSAVIGIYARENGQGMVFEHEEEVEIPPDDTPPEPHNPEGRPSLKIVK